MPLSAIEHLALWGPPLVMLLVTIVYYLRWGKEADERAAQPSQSSVSGDR
ncbi:hypothetical protein [Halovivax limisalsi]|nr:hypothetical protein [Halovivax limisalsi]